MLRLSRHDPSIRVMTREGAGLAKSEKTRIPPPLAGEVASPTVDPQTAHPKSAANFTPQAANQVSPHGSVATYKQQGSLKIISPPETSGWPILSIALSDKATQLCFSIGSGTIDAQEFDARIQVWDLRQGQCRAKLQRPKGSILSISYDRKSEQFWFTSGPALHSISSSGKEVVYASILPGDLIVVSAGPSSVLAAGSAKGQFVLMDPTLGSTSPIHDCRDPILGLFLGDEAIHAATTKAYRSYSVVGTAIGAELLRLPWDVDTAVLSGLLGKVVGTSRQRVFSMTYRETQVDRADLGEGRAAWISPDGNCTLISDLMGTGIALLHGQRGDRISRQIGLPAGFSPAIATFSADSATFAVGSMDGRVIVGSVDSKEE